MDGKTIRLRASCNACNESKVRCSQSKPTCARCERNGIECIYGLSRRTHKDAPPISMPSSSSQRPRGPSRSSSNGDMKNNSTTVTTTGNANHNSSNSGSSSGNGNGNGNWRGMSAFSKSPTATPSTSHSNTSSDLSAGAQDATLFGDYMSPTATHFMIPPQQQQQQNTASGAGAGAGAGAGGAATPQYHIYTQDPTATDPRHSTGIPMLDFSSLDAVTGGATSSPLDDALSAVVTRFPTPGAEYATTHGNPNNNNPNNNPPPPWATTTDMATFWARQIAMAGPATAPPSPPPPSNGNGNGNGSECSCHAGVMVLLASTRGGGGDDRRLSPDAQLAKLRRCIAACESSMGCAHGHEDAEPVHIMAVATLIGYVINEFEVLAGESPRSLLFSSSASLSGEMMTMAGAGVLGGITDKEGSGLPSGCSDDSSMSSGGGIITNNNNNNQNNINHHTSSSPKPRLSWGVLELEHDDEVDLRQRLYLLSFRRLERLLSQLTVYLRALHDAARTGHPDPSRHMAFVMACEYTRLWLERKAEDVKRLFSVSPGAGDEPVDPALGVGQQQHMEL
ncbi:hypothetical protein VMCG_08951 [Cytospora schulzeri]|uniref:Zn(2)-C6 fungal-type domain-containing protein n=1 Tax=Cytospora schulzeri TaxID=448051 RepID=A0A423VNI7_9PEZI|nr:hypothetical protein VMCG_08951 [Valsa malicola]